MSFQASTTGASTQLGCRGREHGGTTDVKQTMLQRKVQAKGLVSCQGIKPRAGSKSAEAPIRRSQTPRDDSPQREAARRRQKLQHFLEEVNVSKKTLLAYAPAATYAAKKRANSPSLQDG